MGSLGEFGSPTVFSRSRFIHDFTKLCDSFRAPYSLNAIEACLDAFDEHLNDSAVVFRCTSRSGDILNFRIFLRQSVDTVKIAARAGFIEYEDPLAKLATSWSSMYNGDSEQWCDFNPQTGLAKTWVNFRRLRPVCEILGLSEFPVAVQARGPQLHDLGLEKICFAAVDYHGRTLNVYFVVPGHPQTDQAAKYASLSGCSPPTEEELESMRSVMGPAFAFAVTIEFETGRITRVAFYALEVPKIPKVNDRLAKFLAETPSYDEKRTAIISWSYGLGNSKYMKGEFGYAGELSSLLHGMVALWKEH